MKICIDDGSTNIKLAWTENSERRNAISPNSFKSEWSAPFGGTQPANYMLDGVRYGFDPVSDRFVQTTDTQYQYSDVNVIAIHHALVKSGITPQEVDVVVTLPLSEYFDTNAQPDMANINRKKANVMRPVEYQNGEAFTIRNVRVMPESIPAGFKALADMSPFESLLIVDLGGTTLDVAKVQGQLAGISQVFCDPHVGVSLMADAVLSVMATNPNAEQDCNEAVAAFKRQIRHQEMDIIAELLEELETKDNRIAELEKIATDHALKFQKAQDALKYAALLHSRTAQQTNNFAVSLPDISEYFINDVFQPLRYERDVERAIIKAGGKALWQEKHEDRTHQSCDVNCGWFSPLTTDKNNT